MINMIEGFMLGFIIGASLVYLFNIEPKRNKK